MPNPENTWWIYKKDPVMKESYKIWDELKLARPRLIAKDNIKTILKDKRITHRSDEKLFFQFLEQMSLISPLLRCQIPGVKQKGKYIIPYYIELTDLIEHDSSLKLSQSHPPHKIWVCYFHPFQVFDIAILYNYFKDEKIWQLYKKMCFYRDLKRDVTKCQMQNSRLSCILSEAKLIFKEETHDLLQQCTNIDQLFKLYNKENISALHFKYANTIFSEDHVLSAMIKLWSLFPDELSIHKSISRDFDHKPNTPSPSEKERNAFFKKYFDWRKEQANSDILSEDEKISLKKYQRTASPEVAQRVGIYFQQETEYLEVFSDLFNIMNREKLVKLTGLSWITCNLIGFQRILEFGYWYLYKKNPFNANRENKPYSYSESFDELNAYRMSVLSDFELLPLRYYVLWVEGETEKRIMECYLQYTLVPYSFSFQIKSMGGSGGLKRVLQVFREDSIIFYAFIDYDSRGKFSQVTKDIDSTFFYSLCKQDKKDEREVISIVKTVTKGLKESSESSTQKFTESDTAEISRDQKNLVFSVFSPNFITTNFTAEEIANCYNQALESLNISLNIRDIDLKEDYEKDVIKHFQQICDKLEYREEIKEHIQNELSIPYDSSEREQQKLFAKKLLCDQLCVLVSSYMTKNKSGGNKIREFQFEREFQNFFRKIAHQRERNRMEDDDYNKRPEFKGSFSRS